jgi:hypothetical protein
LALDGRGWFRRGQFSARSVRGLRLNGRWIGTARIYLGRCLLCRAIYPPAYLTRPGLAPNRLTLARLALLDLR